MTSEYGARIERGIVLEANENGYRVQSLSRDGIIAPAITGLDATAYAAGTIVYFFLFEDGRGKILSACEQTA